MINVIFALIIILLAGLPLFIKSKDSLPLKLSLSYAAGTIIVSLYMLLLSVLRIKFSIIAISLPFILYVIFNLPSIFALFQKGGINIRFKDYKLADLLILALLILLSSCLIINTLLLPVFRADAIGGWVFKAKMFFFERSVPLQYFKTEVFCNTADYPVLVPLNLAWMATCLGSWQDTTVRIFFCFQFITGLVIFYSFLVKNIERSKALLATLITFAIPTLLVNIEIGYVDFSISYYILISMLFMLEWLKTKDPKELLLSAFFMGGAAYTKNDGIGILMAMIITLIVTKVKLSDLIKYILIASAVFMPYKILTVLNGLGSHMAPTNIMLNNFLRLPHLISLFLYELFLNAYNWLYFWILLTILAFIGRDKLLKAPLLNGIIFISTSLLVYIITYLIVPEKVYIFAEGTVNRLVLSLSPAAGYLVFSAVFNENER